MRRKSAERCWRPQAPASRSSWAISIANLEMTEYVLWQAFPCVNDETVGSTGKTHQTEGRSVYCRARRGPSPKPLTRAWRVVGSRRSKSVAHISVSKISFNSSVVARAFQVFEHLLARRDHTNSPHRGVCHYVHDLNEAHTPRRPQPIIQVATAT